MLYSDQERIAYFEEAWHSELSQSEKELVLQDAKQHKYLATLWESDPVSRSWLASDSIDGVTLVDSLDHAGMSLVCRGFSAEGQVVCVKVANYEGHSPQSWDLLDSAIRNEARALKQLAGAKAKFGQLPTYVSDGEFQAFGRQCPYVSMNYIFGLVPIESFVTDSRKTELELWRCISELLGEVHRSGVVHGDLHQRNLHVNSLGKPTLLDFGASQTSSLLPLRSRFEKRHFGPLLALHIDEVLEPHRSLTFAFDVFCLAELMRRRLGRHFEPIDEISPGLLKGEASGNGRFQQSARFYALLRKCTEPEPEHRLRDATKVAQALHNLEFGPAVDTRRKFTGNIQVMLRKNLSIVAFALTCIMFLSLLSLAALIQFQHQRRMAKEQALQAVKDREMLSRLREANQAAIISMHELVEGATDRGRVLEEVDISVSHSVANRLIGLMESGILDLESQVTALSLALQISSSVIELDGWESASSPTLAAWKLADQLENQQGINIPPEVPLYRLQSLAILSRIHYEKGGLAGDEKEHAEKQAESAAKQFLDLSQESYLKPELRRKFSETGFQLAYHALYPQRDEQWTKDSHGELLWRVIDRSLQMLVGHNQRFVRQEASLRRLFGLAMYKGTFKGSPHFPTDCSFAMLAQNEYQGILNLLKQVPGNAAGVSERESRQIQASVKSVFGMLLTNQGKFQEAQVNLQDAYEIRRTTANEFPGSLNRQREFISTGWNYADAIFSEATATEDHADIARICKQEIIIRKSVVEKCLQVLSRDRNRGSEHDYLINSVRLARSFYFSNQTPLALDTIHEIESTIGMEYLKFEVLRFDAIPVLLLHAKHSETGIDFLSSYLDNLLVYVNNPPQPKLSEQDLVFTRTLFLQEFDYVQALPSWPQLAQILNQ